MRARSALRSTRGYGRRGDSGGARRRPCLHRSFRRRIGVRPVGGGATKNPTYPPPPRRSTEQYVGASLPSAFLFFRSLSLVNDPKVGLAGNKTMSPPTPTPTPTRRHHVFSSQYSSTCRNRIGIGGGRPPNRGRGTGEFGNSLRLTCLSSPPNRVTPNRCLSPLLAGEPNLQTRGQHRTERRQPPPPPPIGVLS